MTAAGIAIRSRGPQGLAGVRPAEGLGEDSVEVADEGEEALAEVLQRGERRPLEYAPGQDTEPDSTWFNHDAWRGV